ncbi:MAG: hypothetical protein A3I14_15465 [Candidatus Rokubacteria bacterium RIFCSPLOWO2_02_FULL_73_56]|nr:MAG: hypothetical protein A3I14_15465 [Candidatus Rokubacteria bacterium RIFCSPLOWO2_02_FULL_73_56]
MAVVVSASAVEKLQRRVGVLDKDIARKQEERAELLKRIEAMKILLSGVRNGHKPSPKTEEPPVAAPVTHQIRLSETMTANDADGPSVPTVVKEVLSKKKRLSAVEIRQAIIAAGVPREKLGATYSYLYTVLGRLLQRGQIVRSRGKYELPEGVTIQTRADEEDFKGTIQKK